MELDWNALASRRRTDRSQFRCLLRYKLHLDMQLAQKNTCPKSKGKRSRRLAQPPYGSGQGYPLRRLNNKDASPQLESVHIGIAVIQ